MQNWEVGTSFGWARVRKGGYSCARWLPVFGREFFGRFTCRCSRLPLSSGAISEALCRHLFRQSCFQVPQLSTIRWTHVQTWHMGGWVNISCVLAFVIETNRCFEWRWPWRWAALWAAIIWIPAIMRPPLLWQSQERDRPRKGQSESSMRRWAEELANFIRLEKPADEIRCQAAGEKSDELCPWNLDSQMGRWNRLCAEWRGCSVDSSSSNQVEGDWPLWKAGIQS